MTRRRASARDRRPPGASRSGNGPTVSYHDFTPKTREGKIGKAIYLTALDHRRGFRYDQLGIDDDATWLEIFNAIGVAAINAVGKTK